MNSQITVEGAAPLEHKEILEQINALALGLTKPKEN